MVAGGTRAAGASGREGARLGGAAALARLGGAPHRGGGAGAGLRGAVGAETDLTTESAGATTGAEMVEQGVAMTASRRGVFKNWRCRAGTRRTALPAEMLYIAPDS